MKRSILQDVLKRMLALNLILVLAFHANSQAPIYQFKNATLVSGVARQAGSVYRFPGVITGVDALVTVQTITPGITLQNIDRTADGYSEAFQPEYRISSLTNAYIDFQITFVNAGLSTPMSQPNVDATGLDIDGSGSGLELLKEFNRIDMGGGICTFNTMSSQLSIQKTGTAYTGSNITGILFGALVDTAAYQVMFTVSKNNLATFTYRVGATNLMLSNSTRYASLYFKKFNYPVESILPVSNLLSFSGVTTAEKTKLQWALTAGNNADQIILESGTSAQSFSPLAEFWVNIDGSEQKNFSYTDTKSAGNTAWYRLKIIATDGKIQYSNVVLVKGKMTEKSALLVYPTTVQSAVTAQIQSASNQPASFEITDYSGRVVYREPIQLQIGQNNIRIANLDRLPSGHYISSVKTSQGVYSSKINKY